ncbi:DHH family phosphoesterase [Desulforamulus ferrireducens]|uniref:DHH family phosphoesterase n=1 Tax=Desulforamulus ferrireducens TaxID=1833852 RepID=A0A1S6IX51_9FIRM|nr:bifunctional oligoribonuclease/PAP phosphatase NrnA [Desulforamulus ferrireducens]AQS59335.1 DHH family phosphoesterase [Desulforamulus ferrireducens]
MNDLNVVAETIKKCQRPLIGGHVMPDGDSLGSVLALGLGLRLLGKQVTMASSDPVPELYSFLPGIQEMLVGEVNPGDYDLLIVVDCSVPERLGAALLPFYEKGLTTVVLDHHVNDQPFGHVNYVRSTAAATGEIIMDLLDVLGVTFNTDLAVNLYTAIVTDTGSFRYENTTSETHRRVARLLEYNIPVARLSNLIYSEQPLSQIQLLKEVLATLEVSESGQLATICLSRQTQLSIGAHDEHIEGMINYARNIKNVEVAIFFRELEGQRVKVSFRSKYFIDVNLLAKKFGGGGHVRASGCTVEGTLMEVKAMVVKEAEKLLGGVLNCGRYYHHP